MSAAHGDDPGFSRRIARIEALVAEIEDRAAPDLRERVSELVAAVLELHGAGLARILDLAETPGSAGRRTLDGRLAGDALAASLLALHDLHPRTLAERVDAALEGLRPYMASHGGSVALREVTDGGVVRLVLEGACHGCPSSRATLEHGIEAAVRAAVPEVLAIEVEGVVAPERAADGFVPLMAIGTSR